MFWVETYYPWILQDIRRRPFLCADDFAASVESFDDKYYDIHSQALANLLILADIPDADFALQQLSYETWLFARLSQFFDAFTFQYPHLGELRLITVHYLTECIIMQSIIDGWLSYMREDEYKNKLVSANRSKYERSLSETVASLLSNFLLIRAWVSESLADPYNQDRRAPVVESLQLFRTHCEALGGKLEEYGVHSICLALLYQLAFQYLQLLQDTTITTLITAQNYEDITIQSWEPESAILSLGESQEIHNTCPHYVALDPDTWDIMVLWTREEDFMYNAEIWTKLTTLVVPMNLTITQYDHLLESDDVELKQRIAEWVMDKEKGLVLEMRPTKQWYLVKLTDSKHHVVKKFLLSKRG